MLLNCDFGEDSWESFELQGDPSSPSWRISTLNIQWKDWCWSWISNTLATWWEELTYWKIPWCCKRLKAGWEGDNRGQDGWMASLAQWTWVWASSGRWWRAGRPGTLRSTGSQRVAHSWATEQQKAGGVPVDTCDSPEASVTLGSGSVIVGPKILTDDRYSLACQPMQNECLCAQQLEKKIQWIFAWL